MSASETKAIELCALFEALLRFVPRFEATAAHMPCYQPADNNTSRVAMHSINGRDHGPPSRPRPHTSWKVTELKHMPIANNPCASVDGVKKRKRVDYPSGFGQVPTRKYDDD